MADGSRSRSAVFRLLERYCARNGLRLTGADAHGHAGLVENPTGKRWFFKGTRFDLNSLGASEIANDKAYAAGFLKAAGIAVPMGRFVAADDIRNRRRPPEDILDFAEDQGFPLFIKPNCGREGRDVMRVDTYHTLHNGLQILAKRHEQILVQEEIRGRELRLLLLDGEILCALERHPPVVTGDGTSSLAELIDADPRIDAADGRIDFNLSQQGLMLETVPEDSQTVVVLPVANLSAGGTARIVTDPMPADLATLARLAARSLALRYAAVDLILPEVPRPDAPAIVLEINAAPGLGRLYRQGSAEADLVEEVYSKVFAALFQQ